MDETANTEEVVGADTIPAEETQPSEETPVEQPEEVVTAPAEIATDVAPEDVPIVHKDDGSVGRELDHVVNQ